MERFVAGSRIRQIRRDKGLRQAELARQIGISASYMNLIEANKRPIAGALLGRIAQALEVERSELDSAFQRRLQEDLAQVAGDLENIGQSVEAQRIGEFIGRFPGWARGVGVLARQANEANEKVEILSDRLNNDPYLSDIIYRVVSGVSAVRSAAEILHDYPDAPEARKQRFAGIIYEESRNLSQITETIAGYLDKMERTAQAVTPMDHVDRYFTRHDNCFAELERLMADNRLGADLHLDQISFNRLEQICEARFGAFIDDMLSGAEGVLETEASRKKARQLLIRYASDAQLMPQALFTDEARRLRFDADALAARFAVSYSLVCRRLTTLRHVADLPRFGHYRSNAAGVILEMSRLPGLSWPRYSACPLWVLFRAQQTPDQTVRQLCVFPNGTRFVFVARARNLAEAGYNQPRHFVTDMLAVGEEDSARTVYAVRPDETAEEVGSSCRACPRRRCAWRAEDPLLA